MKKGHFKREALLLHAGWTKCMEWKTQSKHLVLQKTYVNNKPRYRILWKHPHNENFSIIKNSNGIGFVKLFMQLSRQKQVEFKQIE